MPRAPSLASMARELGLSAATVSNAYNHPAKVSPKVRERILRHAEFVKYPGPNPVARQLSMGYTQTIGLIFREELPHAFRHEAAVGFLDGLAQACTAGGYNLLLVPANPAIIHRPIAGVATAAVDGCVAFSMGDDDPDLLAALGRGQPVVVVDQPAPLAGSAWVGLDDRAATRSMVTALIGLGHRRFGALTMRIGNQDHAGLLEDTDLSSSRYRVPRQRMAGLKDALSAAGLPTDVPAVECFTISREAGAAGLHSLLDADPEITAVVSFDDELAIGAMAAAAERGLDVPGDISIAGFDDIPSAAINGLATVRQPLIQKGLVAGELLLGAINGDREDNRSQPPMITLPTEVIMRRSIGRPRSD
jgi:DNA-binding LacI/PurR family transcriptional regulator